MSDLNKLWQEISDKTAPPDSPERIDIRPVSHNALATIRTRTRWKLYFIYFFLAVYIVMFFKLGVNWESRAIFGTMILFALANLWLVLRPYLQMKKQDLLMSSSLREVLQFYHDRLDTMLRQENRIGAWFTPFAAMLGFMLAFVEEKGTATVIFTDWRLLLIMVVTGLILAPLGAWATRWMNKVAFGKYLNYLKENLEQLESK
jgi:hypothetical protein